MKNLYSPLEVLSFFCQTHLNILHVTVTGLSPIESESVWKFLDVRFELLTQAPVAAWAAANPCHVFCCPLPLCLLAQAGLRIAFTGNMILVCANITLTSSHGAHHSVQVISQVLSKHLRMQTVSWEEGLVMGWVKIWRSMIHVFLTCCTNPSSHEL